MNLDESLVNYVKKLSLEEQYKNPKSTFATIAISVSTRPNSGLIKVTTKSIGRMIVKNCCFFVSVYDGLVDIYGDKIGYNFNTLFIASDYKDWNKMIDTDNAEHKTCLQELSTLINVRFLIYLGNIISYNDTVNTWTVNPEPSVTINPRPNIPSGEEVDTIFIANNGAHFECIISDPDEFVRTPNKMTENLAKKIQLYCMNKLTL